jgi:hypothetical protein
MVELSGSSFMRRAQPPCLQLPAANTLHACVVIASGIACAASPRPLCQCACSSRSARACSAIATAALGRRVLGVAVGTHTAPRSAHRQVAARVVDIRVVNSWSTRSRVQVDVKTAWLHLEHRARKSAASRGMRAVGSAARETHGRAVFSTAFDVTRWEKR